MSWDAVDPSILGPALLAGMLVLATHVPLGREVLSRGIIFIDLAIAQISGLGAIAADQLHLELGGFGPQAGAGVAALLGGLLLTWLERVFPDVLEALIGVLFALAATGGILLLANDPHGGEELKDLLVGQILWVNVRSLAPVAALYALVLAVWFAVPKSRSRGLFYVLFAVTITASVQLVGVYLVFATLIVPAVATRGLAAGRGLAVAYAIGALGYGSGLVLSALFDLPTGALIVWCLAGVAIAALALRGPAARAPANA
ncbi:MAG TPA: metal ABC transporter permease [Myxococcota bacterium]|jgi:zinc/manganese transport system permease protein